MKANIKKIAYLTIGLFMILIFYLTYIDIFQGEDLAANPKNRRTKQIEASIVRGGIYDHNGQLLAQTQVTGNTKKRVYPTGSLAGTITGYDSIIYGRTGLESSYNKYLLGLTQDRYWTNFQDRLLGKTQYGDDLTLSLDNNLQSLAQNLLGSRKGAVVALNPKTGAVLALYSNPGFDPNNIEQIWPQVSKQGTDSPLLNRAIQGLYPPGSTMKLITGTLALKNDPGLINKTFASNGTITIDGFTLRDHAAYGQISFNDALRVSSNVVFAQLGLDLGKNKFYQGATDFGFNREIPFDIPISQSTLTKPDRMSKTMLGSSAIGQGEVEATPMEMALVASAIANNGNIMAPYLVSEVKAHNGSLVKKTVPRKLFSPASPENTRVMKDAMVSVVESGTGTIAKIPGIKVAGKTGTAENPHGDSHAWFLGFAPADDPQIVVAVIVENVGFGGTEAAPVARAIIEKALNNEVK